MGKYWPCCLRVHTHLNMLSPLLFQEEVLLGPMGAWWHPGKMSDNGWCLTQQKKRKQEEKKKCYFLWEWWHWGDKGLYQRHNTTIPRGSCNSGYFHNMSKGGCCLLVRLDHHIIHNWRGIFEVSCGAAGFFKWSSALWRTKPYLMPMAVRCEAARLKLIILNWPRDNM